MLFHVHYFLLGSNLDAITCPTKLFSDQNLPYYNHLFSCHVYHFPQRVTKYYLLLTSFMTKSG